MNLGRRNKVKIEGGMSSMTDLVFLLLIFFIIMSTMSRQTLPVDLPSNNKLPNDNNNPLVEVAISPDNLYFFDANNPENYTFNEVVPVLESKMEKSLDGTLKISGDKAADYEAIFNIIALSKQKGWKPVLTYSN